MNVVKQIVIVLATFASLLVASTASAQFFGRNKIQYANHQWKILSTPHFDIHYYEGAETFAMRAGLVLEDGYGMLSGKLKEVVPWKIPVILYANHADFLQTNIDPSIIGEGVQAFAEPRRRRIVLPFTSSFKEFQHTAIHELAHTFTFQIVYNRMLDNVFTRSYLPGFPLWVMEGIAEYLAVGWDADSDMYIRDAIIHDYLPPFYGVGGFYVYKEGQSVFNYIAETYGHEKVLEFLDALARSRSAGAALAGTVGLTEEDMQAQWSKALRKHYWPLYPDKTEVSEIGRRLTDHIKDRGYYNTKPILSPDGEKIAFFSDRSGLMSVLVMSALDGEIIKEVVTGSRSNRYESLHFLTSSMAWDPRGEKVCFIARSKGHDALFVKDIFTGEEQRYEIESDGLGAPAWNPVKNEIVMSATFAGQTDLLLLNLDDGASRRLTADYPDQLTPRWYPDGERIVFVYYPDVVAAVPDGVHGANANQLAELDFLAGDNVRTHADYDIWEFDTRTNTQRPLVQSSGDDTEPHVLSDGKTIIYASDVSGISNLHAGDIEKGEYYRFTDVLGGLFTPSVHEQKGRIAFSGFNRGGHDVFVSDDLPGMMSRRYSDFESGILAHSPSIASRDIARDDDASSSVVEGTGVTISARGRTDEASGAGTDGAGGTGPGAPGADATSIDVDTYTPSIRRPPPPQAPEGEGARRAPVEGITEAVPGEDAPIRGATVSNYKTRLAPDFVGQGGGLYFSTGLGFGISNSVAMSDMLGDHTMLFAFNLYRNIEESDFLLTYSYLKRRVDWSFGAFQFKSYLNSRTTSLGEGFNSYQLFSERNYGIFALMSVPFNMFYRMELQFQSYISDREFFSTRPNEFGVYERTGASTRRLFEPSLALIHDTSFYGPFGPVEGSRWHLSVSRAMAYDDRDVSRFTAFGDYRWYKTVFYRNSFAFRALAATSDGDDPRVFYLGGPTTLRGYDYLQFAGTQMAMMSFEYRFPLIDYLILGWPGRWGFTNIGASLFFDTGTINSQNNVLSLDPNRSLNTEAGRYVYRGNDIYSNVGVGTYMYFGYFLLNFQFAWPTNYESIYHDYQFHFYMGPTF